jgi:ABC-type polysaccharide/polyol phosphate transport system ATPase subunit
MVPISVNNVSKYFLSYPSRKTLLLKLLCGRDKASSGNVWKALENINFTVEPGTCIGFIGRNGSGKSTLLRLLAGIIAPSSGSIEINGKLSTVLDVQSGLHPRLSGIQNIFLKGALHGLSKSEVKKRLDDIVEFSGLDEYINNPIQTYSSGMVIRLGFSIAMHMDFDILLMDEILAVGDIVFQRQCLARVNKFISDGRTIVLATHNLGDVSAICDRVIFLKNGRIQHDGSCEMVLKDYWDTCERAQNTIPRSMHPFNPENIYGTDTKEVKITEVLFCNGKGQACDTFHTGDSLRIAIRFHCSRAVMKPLFRVQFFKNTGLLIHGANTGRIGMDIGELSGDGEMTISYSHLNLLEGDYYVSVGIWPDEYRSTMTDIAYDCHQWAYIIHIKSRREDGAGIVLNPCTWQLRMDNSPPAHSIIEETTGSHS